MKWRTPSHDGPAAAREAPERSNERPLADDESSIIDFARALLRLRHRRSELLTGPLLESPGWALLLDLFLASAEGRKVSVADACASSTAPETTSLRWLDALMRRGLVAQQFDEVQGRRVYLALTPTTKAAVTDYLAAGVSALSSRPAS